MSGLKFHIPDSWKLSKLPDIAEINMGQSPSSSDVNEHGEGMVFFQGKAEFGKLYPIPRKYCTKPTKTASAGSILLSVRAPVGPTNIATQTTAIGRGLAAISACDGLTDPKYLLYYFRYIEPWLSTQGTGSTFKAISGTFIKELVAPTTSFYEQKILAEKLDTLLAQVDSTKARLEQIPKILKRFRQAVLANALRGKLTSKWRIDNKNLQNISSFKASVKRYRFEKWVKEQEEKFTRKGKQPKNDNWKKKYKEAIISQDISDKDIPDGWLFEPLDGLVYISARIGWKGLKASEYTAGGPLFLSVHSLNYGKEVNLSQAYHISEHRYDESPEIKLQNDDVLLCKDGAGIGKLAIVRNLNEPATINSSLLLIRAGDFFIPEYLFYFLSGPEMQNLVKERMTGSAVPHLFQRDVKEFVLEVPPLNEQHEIVRRVEQLFGYADTIEKQVNNALVRVNNLTQSILAKAFRGELTAQWRAENPDLISGENSAAALLEKIKAERAATGSKKAPRKKT
ncbi:TPA: restriction endonuclease subunit S [Yersinia enterocolitica]|uniref:Restriction endonuclease subunit S n=2 Tax=Gammaproteobacteria TaxID=1236 RepID=A0ABY5UQM7_9GAMM|nr:MULTISPECIES: restriction endonuclease subunit S [Yersinia]EKN3559607.1 restriction endonuclease subunit S [Yersinia enterocolitica]OWF67135.1 restriction endonuclease [Yersinia frederiksenii]EKN5936545.1 restriction endonuclease [Yersinia enterocolitica]EKN6051928.1 restriction endonuclease [Yersinia enterocolitica]EKN6095263.1 restriction endonuclease [Yersinia enterocolitica]